MKIENRRCFGQ